MPKIKFIEVLCPHCGYEYKVRLERIGQPFECLACGLQVDTEQYLKLVEISYKYSEVVVKIEQVASVDGDVLIPKRKASSHQG
jgi:hypothetical protein